MSDERLATTKLSRRSVLITCASMLAFSGKRAFSQTLDFSELASFAIGNAVEVRQYAIETPLEEIKFNLPGYVQLDYENRQQTFEAFRQSDISENIVDYLAQLPEQYQLVGIEFNDEAQRSVEQVVAAIRQDSLPIIPDADSVEPLGIPSLPPADGSEDSNIKVVIDIILESLGMDEPGLLTNTIASNPEFERLFVELVQHISSKDWRNVAEAIEAILTSSIVIDAIRELPGPIKRRVLFRLAARAVPIVGWIYNAASIVIAIKSNYHRFSFA